MLYRGGELVKLKAFAIAAICAAVAVDIIFIWAFCRIAARADGTDKEGEEREKHD